MATSIDRPFAVVTGASSGIGYELSKQFLRNGYDVLLVSESTARLNDASDYMKREPQQELSQQGLIETFSVDLASPQGVNALYDRIRMEDRPVDAIAINAGVGLGGEFIETDLAAELRMINLNVVSTVHLAKLVGTDMVKRRQGRILFTASVAAHMPSPFEAVYGASKAFILYFAESLRIEMKDSGVIVTALLPGPTETNFLHRAGMENTEVGTSEKDSAEEVARQGYEALMSGESKIIAGGWATKVQAMLAEVVPSSISGARHRQMSEPEAGS